MANPAIKQHVPIFISSTFEDLSNYREEVERQLVRLEQIVKGMEYFGSKPQNSLSLCLSQVRECKVFIGIIGMRYGSVDIDTQLSFTQLEYNEAISNGIPTLIYIINENHPIPPKFVDTGNNSEKLLAFKNLLKSRHVVSTFTTPEDLGQKVAHDLLETLSTLDKIQIVKDAEKRPKTPFSETFKKFLLRPAKYNGKEGDLFIKIDSEPSGSIIKDDILAGFNLEIGNTISNYGYVVTEQGDEFVSAKKISIYADKDCADWLETAIIGNIIHAKVKLVFCCFKETSQYDGGTLLKNSSYYGLKIIEGHNIK